MLTLNAVSKDIKGVSVLQDINLEFHSGECVLLRGHNGCGKTMLLRLLCGLIRPTGGVITAGGNYRYGVIIENPSFFNGETALYNLRYLANINKIVGVSQIEQVLKSVNLYDVRNKKVRTFSLGMKQRLAICQAVMECPDILFAGTPI
jgi:ABC-2 type transport system ATP-binding protein